MAKVSPRRDGRSGPRWSSRSGSRTGLVKLARVASAHDVGKAINPMALTSQIQGGIMMGLGYALWEELL